MANNDNLDVSIIIVSYNTRDMTVECIRSILEQTLTTSYEIIVIDNASKDGSAKVIHTNFPDIKLIVSEENLGFARANNLAAMHARGRRILLLNPDTVILDRAIDKLHDFASANPECRIWGGRTVFPDGETCPSCWRRMTLWTVLCNALGLNRLSGSSLFNSEGYGGWKRDTVRTVDVIVGCFFLIDRDFWRELHGFDPVFFMYGEEADLCHRARTMGAQPTFTPTATIIHYGGASEPTRADQLIKLFAGKVTLMRRHWAPFSFFVGRLIYLVLPLMRLMAYGIPATFLNRADFRNDFQNWQQVWRCRRYWVKGWSEADMTGGDDTRDSSPLDFNIEPQTFWSDTSASVAKTRSWHEIAIVLYHHIADDAESLTSQLDLTTRSDVFERHVRYFKHNFDLISGTDLINGILPRKSLLITFDDAYRSVLDVAVPVLKAASAPLVFCICPTAVTGESLPIDNILSVAVEELGWQNVASIVGISNTSITSVPQLLNEHVTQLTQAQVREVKSRLCSAMGTTENEIRNTTNIFLDSAGIKRLSEASVEIGNHSMNHSYFRSLSQKELEIEITESRDLLQRLTGQPVPYLGLPYGNSLDATERVVRIARISGHKAIFLVHAKSNRFPMGPDIYYRTYLGNAPTQELSYRLKIMPMLRSARDAFSSMQSRLAGRVEWPS